MYPRRGEDEESREEWNSRDEGGRRNPRPTLVRKVLSARARRFTDTL